MDDRRTSKIDETKLIQLTLINSPLPRTGNRIEDFVLFEKRSALEELESRNAIFFRACARFERGLHRVHQRLRMMANFPVPEQVAKLGIVIAAVFFYPNARAASKKDLVND